MTIAALAFPAAAAWIYFVTLADAPFMPVVYTACKAVQFSFPIAWVALAGSSQRGPSRSAGRMVTAGALTGVAAVGLMGAVYLTLIHRGGLATEAAPRIASRISAMGAASPARYLLMTLFISVAHSFLEEYYWRWFVFGRLRVRWGAPAAGAASSIAFAGHHVIVLHAFIGPGRYWWMTLVLSAAVAAGGALWAWLYERSGSLVSPWISHTLVDLGIFAIGYHLSRHLLQ